MFRGNTEQREMLIINNHFTLFLETIIAANIFFTSIYNYFSNQSYDQLSKADFLSDGTEIKLAK